ncbi:MAG TPA: hypothetical protein VHZ09_02315 [Acidobacteriaceae bacterium]|nr:hypothetical protein [Acidobacteriaceae bacterium]
MAFSCAAPPLLGQVQQEPGTLPDGRRIQFSGNGQHPEIPAAPDNKDPGQAKTPGAPAPNTPPAPAAATLPPSLLDKPAQPAKVKLSDGQLSVTATNSSLSAILDSIETTSGMKIDGLGKDQRIFGIYGPGNPRDVLSSLLDGAGYNFLMVGDTTLGTPSQVILTQRNNAAAVPQQGSSQPQPDDDDQPIVINNPPEEVAPAPRPPSVIPQQNPDHVRTPQEILQELERMRAQQQESPQ